MMEIESVLKNLFEITHNKRKISPREKATVKKIEQYRLLLGKKLSKREKKLLLRIIDGKNSIIENNAVCNFTDGFKLGLKLGLELYKR